MKNFLKRYLVIFRFRKELLQKADMLTTKAKIFQKQQKFEVFLSREDYRLLMSVCSEEKIIAHVLKGYNGKMENVENRNGEIVITVKVH